MRSDSSLLAPPLPSPARTDSAAPEMPLVVAPFAPEAVASETVASEAVAFEAQARRRDLGQWVSRHFNFVYVAASLALLLWPTSTIAGSFGARFLWLGAALTLDVALVQGLKRLFYVPRPLASDAFCWGRRAHSGFPSGHTVPAWILAVMVVQTHPQLAVGWLMGAGLIAWARWRVGAHYAYQIVASIAFGIAVALAVSVMRPQ